jgi:Tfp pilus assembly protein PilE
MTPVHSIRQAIVEDDGLTLVELIVASFLAMVLLLAALAVLDSGTKSERISHARQDALVDLRAAMTRMTKEVRQADSVASTSTATLLDFKATIGGVQRHLVYDVIGTPPSAVLRRSEDGGTPLVLSDRVLAPQAFCYEYDQPNCVATTPTVNLSAIRISLKLSPIVFGSGSVTLATDVELRNL